MQRAYLDSNIIIYLVQGASNAPQIQAYLQSHGDLVLCSSNLALTECLVLPLRQANLPLRRRFFGFFQSLELIPARRQVFLRAARIRAEIRLRTPDALHLAFASQGRCEQFLTGDVEIAQRWTQWGSRYPYPRQVVVF